MIGTIMNESILTSKLPLKNGITRAWTLSIILAILMGVTSLVGLIYTDSVYTSEEQILSFLANDVINLVIGLPILLISMWLTRRGELVGLLLWPGALLYILYNYITYLVGVPFNLSTLAYFALVFLSAYIIFDLLRRIDQNSIKEQLAQAVTEKVAGWVLVVFGALFFFRATAIIAGAIVNQTMIPLSELGLLIADVAISTIWIAGGVLLLQKKPLGYTGGLGLLFVGSVLFLGLILVLVLQPVLLDAPFKPFDVIVVLIMGMICFIPFGLYLRGVVNRDSAS